MFLVDGRSPTAEERALVLSVYHHEACRAERGRRLYRFATGREPSSVHALMDWLEQHSFYAEFDEVITSFLYWAQHGPKRHRAWLERKALMWAASR